MKKISVVGIDDEAPALAFIAHCCCQIAYVTLEATFQNPMLAIDYLQQNHTDLLILDINMPYLNGIELLQKLNYKPLCIFFTLKTEHAIKAFELDVIQYLVKPVDFETFEKATKKAFEYFKFQEAMSAQENMDFIMVKSNYLMYKVYLNDIRYVEGHGEYIILHTTFKQYILLERMHHFLKCYAYFGFVRIHKSYIVLKAHIQAYNSANVLLKNGQKLPVGRSFKESLKTLRLKL